MARKSFLIARGMPALALASGVALAAAGCGGGPAGSATAGAAARGTAASSVASNAAASSAASGAAATSAASSAPASSGANGATASSAAAGSTGMAGQCKAIEAAWTSFLAGSLPRSKSGGQSWGELDNAFDEQITDTAAGAADSAKFSGDVLDLASAAGSIYRQLSYGYAISDLTGLSVTDFKNDLAATGADCGTTLAPLPSDLSSLPAIDQ